MNGGILFVMLLLLLSLYQGNAEENGAPLGGEAQALQQNFTNIYDIIYYLLL